VTVQAIEVTTSTTINHWHLGRQFFDWDNVEQARFLHGMTIGHEDLGGYGHLQINYIVDAAKADGTEDATRRLVDILHDYFQPVG